MQNRIRELVSKVARELGFSGSGYNWHKDCEETVLVLGLQKSRWGGSYYLSGAVWLKELGTKARPKFNECHIVLRLDSLPSPPMPQALGAALDGEDYWRMDEEDRLETLRKALEILNDILFSKSMSLPGIKQFLMQDSPKSVAVKESLRHLLGRP